MMATSIIPGTVPSTMGLRIVFFLLALTTTGAAASAEEVCLEYAEHGEVLVGLQQPDPSLKNRAEGVFRRFIDRAKADDTEAVLKTYSVLDGSQERVEQELRKMPDKFSNYAKLGKVEVTKTYQWGNYVALLADYGYQGSVVALTEPLLCTNRCQLSTIFEAPDLETDLFSRYIYLSQRGRAEAVACPRDGYDRLQVFPKLSFDQTAPLAIYIKQGLVADLTAELSARLPTNIGPCRDAVGKLEINDKDVARLRIEIQDLLLRCTVNTDLGSLIPVDTMVAGAEHMERSWFTVDAMLEALQQAAAPRPIFRIEQRKWTVIGALVESEDGQRTHLMVFPMTINKAGNALFDWSFFATGLGELLTTPIVADYLFKQVQQLQAAP